MSIEEGTPERAAAAFEDMYGAVAAPITGESAAINVGTDTDPAALLIIAREALLATVVIGVGLDPGSEQAAEHRKVRNVATDHYVKTVQDWIGRGVMARLADAPKPKFVKRRDTAIDTARGVLTTEETARWTTYSALREGGRPTVIFTGTLGEDFDKAIATSVVNQRTPEDVVTVIRPIVGAALEHQLSLEPLCVEEPGWVEKTDPDSGQNEK